MRKNYNFGNKKRDPVIKAKGKTRITVYLGGDALKAYREKGDSLGREYQI